jgi:hypothetical protein
MVSLARAQFNLFIAFITTVPGLLLNALKAAPGVIVSVFTTIKDRVIAVVSSMISTVISFFTGLPAKLGGFVSGVGSGIGDFIKRAVNNAISAINSGLAKVDAFIPGDLPRLPLLARGGITNTPSIIGEAGPEAALPLNDARAMGALVTAIERAGGGGGGIINNTVIVEIDGQQLQGRIVETITSHDRRIKQRVNSRRGVR